MSSTAQPSVFRLVWRLLTPRQRRSAMVLLGMLLVGMGLELVGIGLVVPAIVLLVETDLVQRYPGMGGLLERLGNPGREELDSGHSDRARAAPPRRRLVETSPALARTRIART